MMNPLSFPDWMPWWAQLTLTILAIMLGLAFMSMPFSVFGLKARLDALEESLEDMHSELRTLTLRLPEPGENPGPKPQASPLPDRPPIPPSPLRPEALRPDLGRNEQRGRAEPRLR